MIFFVRHRRRKFIAKNDVRVLTARQLSPCFLCFFSFLKNSVGPTSRTLKECSPSPPETKRDEKKKCTWYSVIENLNKNNNVSRYSFYTFPDRWVYIYFIGTRPIWLSFSSPERSLNACFQHYNVVLKNKELIAIWHFPTRIISARICNK